MGKEHIAAVACCLVAHSSCSCIPAKQRQSSFPMCRLQQRQSLHVQTATLMGTVVVLALFGHTVPHLVCHQCIFIQAEVRTLERVSERIKDGIRDIDGRVSHISQTATRIGDRLQVRYCLPATSAGDSAAKWPVAHLHQGAAACWWQCCWVPYAGSRRLHSADLSVAMPAHVHASCKAVRNFCACVSA